MYSRREVCFTVALAVGVSFSFNPRQDTVRWSSHSPCLTIVDGVHPPPPTQPPPKFGSSGQLQAAATEPLLPPWLSDPRSAS